MSPEMLLAAVAALTGVSGLVTAVSMALARRRDARRSDLKEAGEARRAAVAEAASAHAQIAELRVRVRDLEQAEEQCRRENALLIERIERLESAAGIEGMEGA